MPDQVHMSGARGREATSSSAVRAASALLPALVVCMVTLGAAIAGGMSGGSSRDDAVAAVFPPWWEAHQVMGALVTADAVILRTGAVSTVVLATSEAEGLTERLRDAGAWAVLGSAGALACFGLSRRTNSAVPVTRSTS